MVKIICDKCRKEIQGESTYRVMTASFPIYTQSKGDPPRKKEVAQQYHICESCYFNSFKKWICVLEKE